tara:strand:- start:448 stop:978 length:531 start_codon:yes stop_codon:yes gene_type:complete
MLIGNPNTQPAMAKPELLQDKYFEITDLYDLADELLDTVESEFVVNPEQQLEIVEPLVEQIGDAADVLSEEFITIAEGKHTGSKSKIEGALRKIYVAIDDYKERASKFSSNATDAIRNIADPIVKKIKRQMESIVANFMEMISLSLDRIMHKAQVEELKQRQQHIANMLSQLGQST